MAHLLVFVQEHPELAHADALVPVIKAIGDVPGQGAKLAPLLDKGMEEGQTQQQVFEGHWLAAPLKELHVGQRLLHVAAPHIATNALQVIFMSTLLGVTCACSGRRFEYLSCCPQKLAMTYACQQQATLTRYRHGQITDITLTAFR